jgi:ABC-2 type transport system permease protein
MPPWLQTLGWYTPTAWTIEGYHGVLWRGESLQEVLVPLFCLGALGVAGLILAIVVSRIRLKI